MKLNYELTEEQESDILVAEGMGVSSDVIRQHPEWGLYLMNSYWNAERNGEETRYYQQLAAYIEQHPSQRDLETGKLGADFTYFHALKDYIDKTGNDFIPEIPVNEEGFVNVTTAEFILHEEKMRSMGEHPGLRTGRYPITDEYDTGPIKILMCEGNPEAKKIYDNLLSAVSSDANVNPKHIGYFGMTAQDIKMANKFGVPLDLDDMNIRGQQIVDAYEYADHSVEKLISLVRNRDEDMCRYINKKQAQRFNENSFGTIYSLAITNGASFANKSHLFYNADYILNSSNVEKYANDSIEALSIDYSGLDIMEGIDRETGYQIIEAHGFEKYFEQISKNAFDEDVENVLFYNKENGDIIEIGGATEDNLVYSGATLTVWRDHENWHHAKHSSSGFSEEAGLGYNEFSYHNGLFAEYPEFQDQPLSGEGERDKLGYQGIGKIPIPNYIQESIVRDSNLADNLKDPENFQILNTIENYTLKWEMEMILAAYDENIDTSVCPDYDRLKGDPYHTVMKEHGGYYSEYDIYMKAKQFQMAASWMGMPTEERQKYYDALVDIAGEWDEKIKRQAEEAGWGTEPDLVGDIVKEVRETYLTDPDCMEDIYLIGVPKFQDMDAAEYVPWVDMEARDFEDAVNAIPLEESGMEV